MKYRYSLLNQLTIFIEKVTESSARFEHPRTHRFDKIRQKAVFSNRVSWDKSRLLSQQKLLIELGTIATLIQIKNILEFFVSDKPEPGNLIRHENTSFLGAILTLQKNIKTN